jgi:hypothetical protein
MTWTDLTTKIATKAPRVLSNRDAGGLIMFGKNLLEVAQYQGYPVEYHWFGLALKALGWRKTGDQFNTSQKWQMAPFKAGTDHYKTRSSLLLSLMDLARKLDEQGYPYSVAHEQGFDRIPEGEWRQARGDLRSPIGSADSFQIMADEARLTMHTDYPEMAAPNISGVAESPSLKTIVDVTRLFLEQDFRWSQMLARGEAVRNPVAPKVRVFLKGAWEGTLHHWMDVAGRRDPAEALSESMRGEVLFDFNHRIYPAARAVGLPETSFMFPDIELEITVGANMRRVPVISEHGRTLQNVLWDNDRERTAGHGPSFYVLGNSWSPGDFYLFDDPEHGDFTFEGRRFHRYQSKLQPMWEDREDPDAPAIAGEIAPAAGGITIKTELDASQRLHASICVDGKCYQGSANLSGAIAAVMAKLAHTHAQWHNEPFVHPVPVTVGGPDCEIHTYNGITAPLINAILRRLVMEGADITGNNPWNVVTHRHGVELRGTWNRAAQTLTLEITDKDGWPVTCERVWDALDSDLQEVGVQVTSASGDRMLHAIDKAVRAAGDALVGALIEQHVAKRAAA